MPRALDVAAAWSWRVLVVLVGLGVAVFALSRVLVVVLPVIGALLLATVLAPLVGMLRARRWPRLLATWTVLVGALGVLGGIGYGLYLQVRADADEFDVNVEQGVADVEDWLVEGPLDLSRERIDGIRQQAQDWVASGDGVAVSGVVGGAVLAVEVLAGLLLALVLLFFFLKDGDRMWRWICARLGGRAGAHVDSAGRRAWWALGGYVRGQAIIAFADALFIGVGIWVLGVPLVIPLALLTFVGGFLPIVGAVVAGSVAVLVALATEGLVTALILLGIVVAVQQIEGDVLQPVVMSRTVRLHPVVILVAVGAGAALAGVLGAFLAVPVAAAGTAVAGYVWGRVGPGDAPRPET